MPRKTLRILCFGDSLTQGFHSFGMGESPYSTQLAQRLREALPEDAKLEMRTSGVPGDVAAFPRFRERFTQQSAWPGSNLTSTNLPRCGRMLNCMQ